MYVDRVEASTGAPLNIVRFEAFDEPWKGGDDGWGLFDVGRKARHAIQGLVPIASGQYGYVNDGNWHDVHIPIGDIKPHGAMAFGMTDPAKAKLDLTTVTNPFVINDTYGVTGNAAGSTTPIWVDDIYWSISSGSTPTPLTFLSGFADGGRTMEGGAFGGYGAVTFQ